MNYCVLIKISRRKVSFWYQSEGSPYTPLVMKDSNEVPLYFYVNGNDFIFGNQARERFFSNDPNAYGNYFEIVKDPTGHFSIYNNKKPYKQLFYFGIEQYLSYFINTVLYNSNSIESFRPNFPLRFLFESDIEDKEKTLIENIFAEAGYNNAERITFNTFLFEILLSKGLLKQEKSILLLNGIDNNLYFKLYKNAFENPITSTRLEGHGADPRVKLLADIILEYVSAQNPFLSFDKEKETASLLSFCANLLENTTPIIKGEAILMDGKQYWFSIRERELTERLIYYSNDSIIYIFIDDLLKSTNLSIENITIVLGTEEINTAYFLDKLLKKYPNVIGVESIDTNEAMKLLFSEISKSGYKSKKKIVKDSPELPTQIVDIYINTLPPKPAIPEFSKKEFENSVPKTPPILPQKKIEVKNNILSQPVKPGLPDLKKEDPIKNKRVLPPPLPPKKN